MQNTNNFNVKISNYIYIIIHFLKLPKNLLCIDWEHYNVVKMCAKHETQTGL